MLLKDGIAQKGCRGIVLTEVNKAFVDDEAHVVCCTPVSQAEHIGLRDEVARGIVGVDDQQGIDGMGAEERDEVIGCIAIFVVFRNKGNLAGTVEAVGIFLEGGTDEANGSLHVLHQRTDELGGTIARNDVDNDFVNGIYIATARNTTTYRRHDGRSNSADEMSMAKALPHWTVEEFIMQLQNFLNVTVVFNDIAGTVDIINSAYTEGVVDISDVAQDEYEVEVIDDELGDDYAKLGGLTGEEDLHEPLIESMKKRIPWLVVLLFLALGVSSVVGLFEKVMTNLTMIVAFQSLIQGMSGNAGTQSLAVTIRVISDEELDFKQKVSMVFKEIRIGAANGLLLGFLTFALIGLFILFFRDKPAEFAFLVSACIGTALFLAMIMSSFAVFSPSFAFRSFRSRRPLARS